jgi:hypothetical protein
MPGFLPQGEPGTQLDHEPDDVSLGGVLKTAAVLLVAVIVVDLVLRTVMGGFSSIDSAIRARGLPGGDAASVPPPRLQVAPPLELARLKEEEHIRTISYGWVDRRAGVARIPIDRAMEIVSRSGLPRVAPAPASQAKP